MKLFHSFFIKEQSVENIILRLTIPMFCATGILYGADDWSIYKIAQSKEETTAHLKKLDEKLRAAQRKSDEERCSSYSEASPAEMKTFTEISILKGLNILKRLTDDDKEFMRAILFEMRATPDDCYRDYSCTINPKFSYTSKIVSVLKQHTNRSKCTPYFAYRMWASYSHPIMGNAHAKAIIDFYPPQVQKYFPSESTITELADDQQN